MKKRGAVELSVSTIVIVVLAMSMLILGIVLVKNIFSSANDIVDMVRLSFEKRLTDDSLFEILGFIEKVSKKKRDEISQYLSEISPVAQEGQAPQLPSCWDMFLAIAMYSTMETNLNTKRILENAAESCLVIPERMANVLTNLENMKQQE